MAKRGNGEGCIYYSDKLKSYVGQYVVGFKLDGKPNRKSVYGKTRKEVSTKLNKILCGIDLKTYVEKNGTTFGELCEIIIRQQFEANQFKPITYKRKLATCKIISKSKIYNMPIQRITYGDINSTLSSLTNYSNSVIQKTTNIIKATFRRAVALNIIAKNPFDVDNAIYRVKSTKKDKIIEALTVDEQKQLLAELEITNDTYKDIIKVALYTGMRIGEILALKKEDIDLNNDTIHITKTVTKSIDDKVILGDTTKTYAGQRTIPLLAQIKPIFESKKEGLLFTHNRKLIAPATINSHFKRICKNAGIRPCIIDEVHHHNKIQSKSSNVNTHMLRHTFATRCIEAGMQAVVLQKILGHTDVSVTLNTYTSVFNAFKNEEVLKVATYLQKL